MPQVVGPLTMRKPAAGSLLLAGDLKVAAPLDPNFAPYKISKKVSDRPATPRQGATPSSRLPC